MATVKITRTVTHTRTKTKKNKNKKKSSGQKRCPTCGKYM